MNQYSMIVQWTEEDQLFLVTIDKTKDKTKDKTNESIQYDCSMD